MMIVSELTMVAFSDRAPERDDHCGEQTILTYNANVGVYGLEFFESGWKFPDKWIGGTHWLDITQMWPGVTAQVAEITEANEKRLLAACSKARDTFLEYERLHRLKGSAEGNEKADRNRDLAEMLSDAIGLLL